MHIERGADLVALELGVGIIRIAEPQTQTPEQTVADVDIAEKIGAELFQPDRDELFLALLFGAALFLAVMPKARTRRHAVIRIVPPDRRAERAVVDDKAEPRIHGPGFGGRIGNDAALIGGFAQFRRFFGLTLSFLLGRLAQQALAQAVGELETADLVIVRSAVRPVYMHDEIADRHVQRRATLTQVVSRVPRSQRIDVERLFGNAARDALVHDVHGTADRLASVKEHGRTAKHLDAFGRQRVDGGGMVHRCVRDVRCAEPVDEHFHTLPLKPA